jgi:hypothetical protein
MRYDTEELRTIAQAILAKARKNVKKHGGLQPVGLAYGSDGHIDRFVFQWDSLEKKRRAQRDFQMELLRRDAAAAVIISEAWAKFADNAPIDLSNPNRSVRDMPGRKDAIIVEAGSPLGRIVLVQTFTKTRTGKISFDAPNEYPIGMIEVTSEFLDALWPVHPARRHTTH